MLRVDMLAREYGWTPKEIEEQDPGLIEALCIVISERIAAHNKAVRAEKGR